MQDMPSFSSGNTELTSANITALMEQLRRAGRMIAAPPLEIVQIGEGWLLRLSASASMRGLWARIDESLGDGSYSLVEQTLGEDGFEDTTNGRVGDAEGNPAREINRIATMEPGSIVWLFWVASTGDAPPWYFFAPVEDSPTRPLPLWVRLDGETLGEYGYVEVERDGATFIDRAGGLSVESTEEGAAVEASGAKGIASGTIVPLFSPVAGEEKEGQPVFAFAGGGSSGFWAMLGRFEDDTGIDTPFSDGKGGYVWTPIGLAYESAGRLDCPKGIVGMQEDAPGVTRRDIVQRPHADGSGRDDARGLPRSAGGPGGRYLAERLPGKDSRSLAVRS